MSTTADGVYAVAPANTAPVVKDTSPAVARNDNAQTAASSAAELHAAVQELQAAMKSAGRAAEFHIDAAIGPTVVTIKDSATGAVIRQMPSEEVLALARNFGAQRGTLLNLSV